MSRLGPLCAALVALLLVACADVGPVFPTPNYFDPWVSAEDTLDPRSDRAPLITYRTATFRLFPGESRSALRTDKDFGLGQTYLIGFDLRVDRRQLTNRPVTLSRVLRTTGTEAADGSPATQIISVELDARRGATVLGRSCIPPAQLGRWHSIEIRIAMADNDTGYIEVFCDRRPIWAQENFRTTLPPICRLREGCTRGVPRPVKFEWQLGLMADGRLARGLEVQMRRIFYHRLFVIPNRVHTL
ncbi:hypothetical protein [Marimonas arenosa]|uniref:Lipoprotein n=1 Tax=Marimonas arenosa TaxID=1795305 RepID=A0AAE4B6Y4_9RHOB|nr:hypothetical protein [Marimonas arenosa]MDQ2091834.1 hypothetical protein [Marimonas arenosa]